MDIDKLLNEYHNNLDEAWELLNNPGLTDFDKDVMLEELQLKDGFLSKNVIEYFQKKYDFFNVN